MLGYQLINLPFKKCHSLSAQGQGTVSEGRDDLLRSTLGEHNTLSWVPVVLKGDFLCYSFRRTSPFSGPN